MRFRPYLRLQFSGNRCFANALKDRWVVAVLLKEPVRLVVFNTHDPTHDVLNKEQRVLHRHI